MAKLLRQLQLGYKCVLYSDESPHVMRPWLSITADSVYMSRTGRQVELKFSSEHTIC